MLAEVFFEDLGYQTYREVWDYQELLLQQNTQLKSQGNGISTRHHFLLVEHPPVYTLVKSGKLSNLLFNEAER